jgi:glycosyltransferase involved in cell wall biosynthesis
VRIAVVGPAHPFTGGSAQHTTSLAHELSAAGHQVTLQSWSAQCPKLLYPGQLTVGQPEVELFPDTERSLAWNRPDSWWRTGRRLAGRRLDAVMMSVFSPIQAPPYLALARAARAGGCAVIALCHNVLPHERRKPDELMIRALLGRMDAVLVHSREEATLASARTSAPVEVAALPLHLPAAERHPALPSPRPRRNRLLFFGMVRHYKGLDLLLRALAETNPEVSLRVAGEIWYGRDDLLRLISDLRLGDRVTMSDGYVPMDDVPAIFAAADALVLPYRSGTASQNALIALQFGVPVIATRAGAIADSVADGINGLLCAPDDVAALARAIGTLYEPGTLERLQLGVRPPETRQAWRDYVAAVESAVSSARGRARMDRQLINGIP